MKNVKVISLILFTFILLLADTSFAQGWGRGRGMGRGLGRGMMFNQDLAGYGFVDRDLYAIDSGILNLTQDQINRINEIDIHYQTEFITLSSNLDQKDLELDNLIRVTPPVRGEINKKIAEIKDLEADLQKKNIAYDNKLENILTDEQKVLWNKANVGYPEMNNPYYYRSRGGLGQGFGYGAGMYGSGFGRGIRYGAGNSAYTSGRMFYGRGPCGMGLGKNSIRRNRWYDYD